MRTKIKEGFTLIELLVVIAIIALLASIVLVAVSASLRKARSAQRATDLRQIATALTLYYYDNNDTYPNTNGFWRSQCNAWGGYASDQVIPGLVPKYLPVLLADPQMNIGNSRNCFLYQSYDGRDYKLLDHYIDEFTPADYASIPSFVDPARDGGTDPCSVDGNAPWAWAIWSSGPTNPMCW